MGCGGSSQVAEPGRKRLGYLYVEVLDAKNLNVDTEDATKQFQTFIKLSTNRKVSDSTVKSAVVLCGEDGTVTFNEKLKCFPVYELDSFLVEVMDQIQESQVQKMAEIQLNINDFKPFETVEKYYTLNYGGPVKERKDAQFKAEYAGELNLKATLYPASFMNLMVCGARQLPATSGFNMENALSGSGGSSDPFATIKYGETEIGKTKAKNSNLNPNWNECFSFETDPSSDKVTIEIRDYNVVGNNELLCTCDINLKDLNIGNREHRWFPCKKEDGTDAGELRTRVLWGELVKEVDVPPTVQGYEGRIAFSEMEVRSILKEGAAIEKPIDGLFCVTSGESEFQTSKVQGTTPKWEENFSVPVHPGADQKLTVAIKDKNMVGSDTLMGSVDVPLAGLFDKKRATSLQAYELKNEAGEAAGKIVFNMVYNPLPPRIMSVDVMDLKNPKFPSKKELGTLQLRQLHGDQLLTTENKTNIAFVDHGEGEESAGFKKPAEPVVFNEKFEVTVLPDAEFLSFELIDLGKRNEDGTADESEVEVQEEAPPEEEKKKGGFLGGLAGKIKSKVEEGVNAVKDKVQEGLQKLTQKSYGTFDIDVYKLSHAGFTEKYYPLTNADGVVTGEVKVKISYDLPAPPEVVPVPEPGPPEYAPPAATPQNGA